MAFRAYVQRCGIVKEARFAINGVTLLIGPNGAGKTTLLRSLVGALRCNCSLVDEERGVDLCRLPPWERGIGYVPQSLALFHHMSVYDNIAFGLRARGFDGSMVEERVRHLARMLGVEALLHRPAWSLSGGEASRVAVARALAVEPRLLVLDEALDHIDAGSRAEILRVIREYARRGMRVLIVTHHIAELVAVVGVDRVVVMDEGRVVYEGAPSPNAIPEKLQPVLGRFEERCGTLAYRSPAGLVVGLRGSQP